MYGYPEGREGLIASLRRGTALEIDDSGTQQIIKKLRGMAGEMPEDVYRAQAFGHSAVPPSGAEGLFLSLGGRSDRLIGLGFEHKDHRPKGLPSGVSVLYDDKGNIVYVKGTNGIEITAKKGKVTIKPEPGQNVYLGGDGADGSYAKVSTVAGPALNVYARIA